MSENVWEKILIFGLDDYFYTLSVKIENFKSELRRRPFIEPQKPKDESQLHTPIVSTTYTYTSELEVSDVTASARQTASCIIYLRGTVAAESSWGALVGAHLYVRGRAHGGQLVFGDQSAVERHVPPLAAGLRHAAADHAHWNNTNIV